MKKKFTIIYSIIASAFFLFALIFLGFNLNREYKQGISRTSSIFANAVFNLTKELEKADSNKKSFYNKVTTTVNDFQDFSFYELKENDDIVFSYPANLSKDQTKSNFTKNFSTVIDSGDNKYLLTCNIYLLRPYSIYYYSKIAFFIILGVTLVTFIMILIPEGKKDKKSKEKKNSDNNDKLKTEEDSVSQEKEKSSECDNNFAEYNYEENNEAHDIGVSETSDEDLDINYNSDNSLEDFEEQTCEEEKDLKQEEQDINDKVLEKKDSILTKKELEALKDIEKDLEANTEGLENEGSILDGPEGLFSPSTGLGWESYLITRLDNELERSVASEMDISLFIIKITDLSRESELAKTICDYLVNQFQFRDLIFEYKEDCVVAIKNSTPIEDALTFADKIHSEIMNMLENNTSSKCYIGISTRTVRIISGERFLNEAEEALLRAEQDQECPIIAFRADIEKYKKYLEKQVYEEK